MIRNAWDGKTLQTIAKNTPVRARDAHIAIVGHITKDELLRYITATELANAFFNSFLVIAVQRSQELPFGGRLAGDELARVRTAILTALGSRHCRACSPSMPMPASAGSRSTAHSHAASTGCSAP